MANEVKLPQLGQTMEEGTIVGCLVKIGDEVKKGDVIFEVETDKATLEMESPAAGFVKHIAVEVNQTIPVGDAMLILGDKDEVVKVDSAKSKSAEPAKSPVADASPAPAAAAASTATADVKLPEAANVVKLPQLGQTMEEGTIVGCLVKVGDEVKKGDVIFEVETDKATLEMESPAAGFVKCVIVEMNQTIPVGDAMLVLGDKDLEISAEMAAGLKSGGATPAAQAEAPVQAAPVSAASVTQKNAPAKTSGKIFASPRAKKLAKELGVDLSTIAGSGANGRIVEADIKKTPAKAPAANSPVVNLGETVPVNRLQKITAQRMLQSKQEIPCFYLTVKVDVTELAKLRSELNANGDVKLSYNDFLMKAVACGLQEFGIMTGQSDGKSIKLADSIGIGLAIAVPDGLVAPIVKDVGNKTLKEINQYSQALIGRARSNKLAPDDLAGGCITVSTLGAFGIESFIPIVVPGQCSILGIGQIADTCVPVDGNIMIRKMMSMTLSVDHKVTNGAYAAQFLNYVGKYLEDKSNFA